MTSNWLKRTLVGVVTSAALVSGIAYAQGGFHGPATGGDMAEHQAQMLAHIGKRLNLDAAQAAKLQVLATQLKAQHSAMMGGTKPGERMQALIAGNTFDRAGAQQLVNEKVAQLQSGSPALIAAVGDFFDSLNATQQQQVREFLAHHHHRGMGPHGHPASAPAAN